MDIKDQSAKGEFLLKIVAKPWRYNSPSYKMYTASVQLNRTVVSFTGKKLMKKKKRKRDRTSLKMEATFIKMGAVINADSRFLAGFV